LLALSDASAHKACAMSSFFHVVPLARRYLPKTARRFIVLNVLGGRRLKNHLRARASRIFLDGEILPWIAKHYSRVLSVGTAPYAFQAEKLFRRGREHYTTIEPETGPALWGARNHIVAPIQEIGRHRPIGHFDCIVFNGVFGFGIDTLEEQRHTIKVLYDALAPGGLLLVGWNTNLTLDPEELGLFDSYFVPAESLPWPHRTRFPLPETHVYDFYTRRPE
jgi:SAM-dependent methyltransferase